MVVYIEYAFAENFLIDGALLFLALRAAKAKVRAYKLLLSAALGASFALVYPLIRLPTALSVILKISVGCLLCLLVVPPKYEKPRSARGFVLLWFFALSFAFAGGVFALYAIFDADGQAYTLQRIPATLVLLSLFFFISFSVAFIRKANEKRSIHKWIYPCILRFGERKRSLLGFLDSGNLAKRHDIPVCFVSPDIIYDVFTYQGRGQVCDEITVCTVGGQKTLPLYKGEIAVQTKEKTLTKEVYFAPSTNMICKEYSMLLPSNILEE